MKAMELAYWGVVLLIMVMIGVRLVRNTMAERRDHKSRR